FVGEELERPRELWLPDQRANRRNVGDAVGIWAEKNSGRLFIGAQTVEAAGRNSLIDGRDREALPSSGDRGREDDLGLQPWASERGKITGHRSGHGNCERAVGDQLWIQPAVAKVHVSARTGWGHLPKIKRAGPTGFRLMNEREAAPAQAGVRGTHHRRRDRGSDRRVDGIAPAIENRQSGGARGGMGGGHRAASKRSSSQRRCAGRQRERD